MKPNDFLCVTAVFGMVVFDQCIFYTLVLLSVAVQVWPEAAFRQHPFLVADLPWRPDIGDLYSYILACMM